MGKNCYRGKTILQRLTVSGDVDSIGKAADDERRGALLS